MSRAPIEPAPAPTVALPTFAMVPTLDLTDAARTLQPAVAAACLQLLASKPAQQAIDDVALELVRLMGDHLAERQAELAEVFGQVASTRRGQAQLFALMLGSILASVDMPQNLAARALWIHERLGVVRLGMLYTAPHAAAISRHEKGIHA